MSDMADFAVDFGEPNPVVVPRTYTEAEVREAKAVALEEAADVMDKSAEALCMMWGDMPMNDAATATLSATRHEARRVRARASALRGVE